MVQHQSSASAALEQLRPRSNKSDTLIRLEVLSEKLKWFDVRVKSTKAVDTEVEELRDHFEKLNEQSKSLKTEVEAQNAGNEEKQMSADVEAKVEGIGKTMTNLEAAL